MKLTLKHKRFIVLGVDLALVICFIILYFLAPTLMGILPDCVLRRLGLPCLGCGGTRCLYEFVHFNFTESFWLHPFAFISIILAIIFLIICHLAWVFGIRRFQRIYDALMHPAYSFSYLGIFILFCLLRITCILPTP